jgi:hypothetical protein
MSDGSSPFDLARSSSGTKDRAHRAAVAIGVTLLAAAGFGRAFAAPPGARSPVVRDTASDTWAATDALGRSLPDHRECGKPRPGKYVGIFYFLWMDRNAGSRVFDISKLLAENPASPKWGPPGAFHWWGEPRFGYYRSDDEFVIRKHAQMLADAGVDVLFFDVTNALTYDETYQKLCKLFTQIRQEGGRTPQVAFLANSHAEVVVRKLFDTFYSQNLDSELWFRWKGKPLILAPASAIPPNARDFFTVRQSWAWTDPNGWFGDGKDRWPWLDHTPQKPGWHTRRDQPEEMCVCVAEHPIANIGRSFHDGREPSVDNRRTAEGPYFTEQWRHALEVDPEFVLVTGWNEWIAQRFIASKDDPVKELAGKPLRPGDTYFVDAYNQEYSRDIEPMHGGHGDSYYSQLTGFIRRFKGVRPTPRASAERVPVINNDFHQWDVVQPAFLDDLHDPVSRDHPGFGGAGPYVNSTGRNDLDTMKVAHDGVNFLFYLRTRLPFKEPDAEQGVVLWLDVDANHATGWEGYDFVVNRVRSQASGLTIERRDCEGTWRVVGAAPFVRRGNELHLAIAGNVLGWKAGGKPLAIDFKWSDNVPDRGDVLDVLDNGDAAPNGRFNYQFRR